MGTNNKGLIYVFTGQGKGKTSAALGVATRAALIGEKVVWISFYKGKDWDLAEKHLPEKISKIEMHFVGKGFRIEKPEVVVNEVKIASVGQNKVVDTASEEEHVKAAVNGMQYAVNSIKKKPFLLVLDEVLNAISEGLLNEKAVLKVLEQRGETHIVLTGRGVSERLVTAADLVTECKKIKHPYDVGKLAVRGLDF